MLTAENKGYAIKGKALLQNISLSFYPDEISLIIGPNGAGKSTFINLLSRNIVGTSGVIKLNGVDLNKIPLEEIAKVRAVLSQSTHLAFPLTVKEVVMMGRYPHFKDKPAKLDREICAQCMGFFKVEGLADRNYLTLSGGEKQRVQFARVTAQIWPDGENKTKILLLDEPLTHLDIYYQYELLNQLKGLMKKQSLVIVGVVHDLNLAYKYADKVSLLHEGKLLTHGTVDQVFTSENIFKAFKLQSQIVDANNGDKILWLRNPERKMK